MIRRPARTRNAAMGFLARLSTDARANVMAIVAASMVPLIGMVGGGFDLSRMYIVKTRLQHACDAGALAGRKAMGGGTWAQQSYLPRTEAVRFFEANIADDAYGATNMTKTFTENAGKVRGSASAVVPMTLMRVFGQTEKTLTVTCDAEMRLPNTDVMFVLDVTGSMNCRAGDTSCTNNGEVPAYDSKIGGLKLAVKCFYEIVARLDTNAVCATGAPSGGTGNAVQIRFGFVPYASNVNVGRLLPTNYMADNANYTTRAYVSDEWTPWSGFRDYNRNSQNNCNGVGPTSTSREEYSATAARRNRTDYCYVERRLLQTMWKYDSLPLNVGALKNGAAFRTSFSARIGNDGTMKTINWDGCIEERQTVQASNYRPIPAGAKDLNIDLIPVAGDESTRWKPSLPEAIFLRKIERYWYEVDAGPVAKTEKNYYNSANYYCPTEARKLQTWGTASTFANYVDSLVARGNTYHDIGLIWGARMLSPTGIFASENAVTSQGGEIERHLIFMTDGDAASAPCDYNAYGIAFFDKRQTTNVGSASECQTQRASLSDQINLRLEGICEAVKNKNITLWVVSFGAGNKPTTEERLENCASDNRYFLAEDSAALQQTFKSIADQISALRLTE